MMDTLDEDCILTVLHLVPPTSRFWVALSCSRFRRLCGGPYITYPLASNLTMEAAAEMGFLPWKFWWHRQMLYACRQGDEALMRMILVKEPLLRLTQDHAWNAASSGSVPCLSLLRDMHCEWNERVCFHAAFNGHIDVLGYALREGCPIWIGMTFFRAVRSEHVHVLHWLFENGFHPYDSEGLLTISRQEGCYASYSYLASRLAL